MIPASRGGFRYDFAVYDGQGRLSAVVEAKRRFGTDASWAREWHASTVKRMNRPVEASVVLVAADHVYAWRPGAGESANPDWTFESGSWLAPYFERLKIPLHEVAPHIFDEIVGLWLQDVVQGELPDGSNIGGAEDLLAALRGGEVVQQVAA